MPIRPPILDDRRYDDLVAELVARIPAHTPEWTHPRPGDPGRTLIELFAWLGDALLYRVNLIPERQRLAFLRLLGQPLRPAQSAKGLVNISLKDTETAAALALTTPARFTGPGEVPFESRTDLMVLPVEGTCWVKRPAEIENALNSALTSFYQEQLHDAPIAPYVTEPLFAGNQPELNGFDLITHTTDRCLWLALLAAKAGDPFTDEGLQTQQLRNAEVARILGGRDTAGRALLNIGFVPALPAGDALEPATARARVPHLWELTANLSGQQPAPGTAWMPEYMRLDEVSDSSYGLTRPGIIRLALPEAPLIYAPSNDVRVDPSAGVGDRPPRLDDEAVAARLVTWIRLRPAPARAVATSPSATQFRETTAEAAEAFGQPAKAGLTGTGSNLEVAHLPVTWLGINAVEVDQLSTVENVILGQSSGGPDQLFALPVGSIEPSSLQVEVEESGAWIAWQRVDDLQTFGDLPNTLRDARVFTLDAEAGTLQFGDDVRGRVPPVESRIRARRFRSGGGVVGNIAPGTLKTVSATTLKQEAVGQKLDVSQPLVFSGGAPAPTLAEAEKSLPAALRHCRRAVTAEDYKTLTLETPGVTIGRVEVLPGFKPQQRFFNIPGVISLMALPDRPLAPAPNPRADRPFLEAIYGWMDARRPLATELYVIGCDYVPVSISLAVTFRDGSDPEATLQEVKDALRRVLWPLSGGGFDGRGWALGRGLSNRELAVEVARVSGVAEIAGLNLFKRQAQAPGAPEAWIRVGDAASGVEQNLGLEPFQLPELMQIYAVADDSAAPLTLGSDQGNPFANPNAIGVPVVPKLC